MDNVKVADDYKDRLFRMIFNDKEKLLELYNAMNRSDYTDASELQVVTLENAIYVLYLQQSHSEQKKAHWRSR